MNPFPSGFKLFMVAPSQKPRLLWRLVSPSGKSVRLTEQQGVIMSQLLGRYGRPVFRDDLLEALWGDDPEGGPLCPVNVIKVQMNRLRHVCRALGIDFDCGSNWAHQDKDNAYTLKNLRECNPVGKVPAWYSDRGRGGEVKLKFSEILKKEEEEIFFSYRGVRTCKIMEAA